MLSYKTKFLRPYSIYPFNLWQTNLRPFQAPHFNYLLILFAIKAWRHNVEPKRYWLKPSINKTLNRKINTEQYEQHCKIGVNSVLWKGIRQKKHICGQLLQVIKYSNLLTSILPLRIPGSVAALLASTLASIKVILLQETQFKILNSISTQKLYTSTCTPYSGAAGMLLLIQCIWKVYNGKIKIISLVLKFHSQPALIHCQFLV